MSATGEQSMKYSARECEFEARKVFGCTLVDIKTVIQKNEDFF